MLVGGSLRQFRESRGITREAAGSAIRGSHSKISRMELGQISFKLRDIEDLLTLYGVIEEAERSPLLALARRANQPGWWHEYRDVVPDWFQDYLGLEQDAELIRTYEIQLIPGLLQTEDYARAVIAQGHQGAPREQIERRVALRMRRQQVLVRSRRLKLWALLDEAALRRTVGGTATMYDQLRHLGEMSRLPNVTVQVSPFSTGGAVGGVGPFTVLRFAETALPDVVYLEQLTTAYYLNKEADVCAYKHLLNEACADAPPPDRTAEILQQSIDAL
ncbi:helix-turn-helix domain-containing protein [Acrocarpospora catenulata]|uniref:helix-turn-helix domain-containing protein n=1 Tax=Acrocarpospora catenulata TaxID=2836182 RepID=UPI002023B9BD|nr:helix-turn-helix transcriptional regulator [Acrocarpospora catenulata]